MFRYCSERRSSSESLPSAATWPMTGPAIFPAAPGINAAPAMAAALIAGSVTVSHLFDIAGTDLAYPSHRSVLLQML